MSTTTRRPKPSHPWRTPLFSPRVPPDDELGVSVADIAAAGRCAACGTPAGPRELYYCLPCAVQLCATCNAHHPEARNHRGLADVAAHDGGE
jgi:hypothetical protein